MTISIATQSELAKIGVDPAYPLSGEYRLANDIALAGQWTPIAPITLVEGVPVLDNKFTGTFDGNGKTISGLYIEDLADGACCTGLFGCIWGGWIKNLKLRGECTLKNAEGGGQYVGGMASVLAAGGIIEQCDVAVDVTGYAYVAPICPFILSGGSIVNCKTGGTVTGTVFVSGVCCGVADFEATKDVAYIAKNVFTGTLVFTGVDPAKYGVGMICFKPVLADPQIYFASDRCYWDYTKSAYLNSYVGENKTTEELYQQATYVHWNFESVWTIDEGNDYPRLRVFDLVSVPAIEGETIAVALAAIQAAGLDISVTLTNSDTVDSGYIVSQSPSAGAEVAHGSTITITISIGSASATASGTTLSTSDMLRSGVTWLGKKRVANCSSVVSYRRPPDSYAVNATYGKTSVEVSDESGMTIVAKVWDFIIQADEMEFDPEPGDLILADGRLYEVMNLGGEAWRWSDPFRTAYRIHTKDTGGE